MKLIVKFFNAIISIMTTIHCLNRFFIFLKRWLKVFFMTLPLIYVPIMIVILSVSQYIFCSSSLSVNDKYSFTFANWTFHLILCVCNSLFKFGLITLKYWSIVIRYWSIDIKPLRLLVYSLQFSLKACIIFLGLYLVSSVGGACLNFGGGDIVRLAGLCL